MSERLPPIVGLTGATCGDRRLTAAVAAILAGADELPGGIDLLDYCGFDEGIRAARFRSQVTGPARDALAAIEASRGLVLGVPVERGTVPGLFKHLLDLADPDRLRGKPAILVVHRHAADDPAPLRRQVEFLSESFGLELLQEVLLIERGQFASDGRLAQETGRLLARAGRTLALAAPGRFGETVDAGSAIRP